MRIGLDARLVFYHQAGIGQYILRLTNALTALDHENEYFLFQSRKDSTRLADAPNFHRRVLWTPSHHRFERLAMSAELAPYSLDVFHSPDFIPPRKMRAPNVITVHDLAFLLYPRFLTPEAARYYGQIDPASRAAAHIIAVSQSTKRDVTRLLGVPEDKVSVIYEAAHSTAQPIPRAEARTHVRAKFGIEDDFILFVSTIEPRKNLPTLLAAYSKLRDAYASPARLVVAGHKGWLTDEVDQTIAKYKLHDKVCFLGSVPTQELAFLYSAARVFALPSFYEGFGLPPLEAMASGTPVVVSNVSSLPEVVGDAGILLEPNDVEAWAVALHRVLTDNALHDEMSAKGLKRAAHFSWERAARETLDVYRQVAKQ
ncbi:MAG: glycosyltransferase family 4 protein [Chloroflexi bacterium]|nr:glycosyltransferase family 4 protein [Chloroflexota bacterium]